MIPMKIAEIRSKKPDVLAKEEAKLKKELMSLKAQVAMGTTPKSPGQIRSIKKTLARIITVRKEEEMYNSASGSSSNENKVEADEPKKK